MVVEGLNGTDSFLEATGDALGSDDAEAEIVDGGGVLETDVVGALDGDEQFQDVAVEDVD